MPQFSIKLKSGLEIPVFTMPLLARVAVCDVLVDVIEKPALRARLYLAVVGMAWEHAASQEARVPLAERTVPAPTWKPFAKCDGDVYGYGAGVIEAVAAMGESVMALRAQGDLLALDVWESLNPSAEAVARARGNLSPEAAGAPASSGSPLATSEAPSPPST